MRAFQQKKITIDGMEVPAIDMFDYTSSLSGGHFPNLMYAYAKDTTSDLLLDVDGITEPSELTKDQLENIPETSIFGRFATSIIPHMVIALLSAVLLGTDVWSSMMYTLMLEPFGIGPFEAMSTPRREDAKPTPIATVSMFGPAEMWPDYYYKQTSAESAILKELISNYADSGYTQVSEGVYQAPDTSFMWEMARRSGFQVPVYASITPDEFNIEMHEHKMEFDPVGDMTAEPLNFKPVFANPDDLQPESEGAFSIAKALGAATNALPLMGPDFFTEEQQSLLNRPIKINIPTADENRREMVLLDAGANGDGTGIPALVQKKVRKIIGTSYFSEQDWLFDVKPYAAGMEGQISSFFGLSYSGNVDVSKYMFNNTSSNGESQFLKMYNNMKALFEAGEPMISTLKDLDVIENKFYGIEGGYKVDLTLIILIGVPKIFADALPIDVAPPLDGEEKINENGYLTNPEFSKVPNMYYLSETAPEINIPELDMNFESPFPDLAQETKATKMSYTLCSWMIHRAWDGLFDANGEMRFEGFPSIFT
jgi:hypothetical protein